MTDQHGVVTTDELFVFQYESFQPDGSSAYISVAYVASDSITAVALTRALRDHLTRSLAPQRVVILGIGSPQRLSTIERLRADQYLAAQTAFRSEGTYSGEIEFLELTREGFLRDLKDPATLVWSGMEASGLFSAGLALIFDSNGAVLDSRGLGFHFVAPSGRHQTTFVRVGNAFSQGSQTSFAASALLRLVPPRSYRSIYVDSSSIGALGHELAGQMSDLGLDSRPTVSSFGGYEGLGSESFPKPSADSLVLISYSATGRLAQEVLSTTRQNDSASVISVFADEAGQSSTLAACDLGEDNGAGRPRDIQAGSTGPDEPCPQCASGHSTIVLSGDQLLPISPQMRVEGIMPSRSPKALLDAMQDLIRFKTIKVNVRGSQLGVSSYTREIYLDLDSLSEALEEPALQSDGPILKDARLQIAEAASSDTTWVIATDDVPSNRLARIVFEESVRAGARMQPANIISARDFIRSSADDRPDLGSGEIVVVAGAIATGRTLLLLCELLRYHHLGKIRYIALFARGETDRAWQRLQSTLRFGPGGRNHHQFSEPRHIELPTDRRGVKTPWESEISFWSEWVLSSPARLKDVTEADRLLVASRTYQIQHRDLRPAKSSDPSFEEGEGIRDRLFLAGYPSPDLAANPELPHHLRLQSGFSFWNFGYEDLLPVQADVFATFSAAFNWMRNRHGANAPLFDQTHNRTVVDPDDFFRYSDAVGQSSILRAANPVELNYSSDANKSAQMVSVLESLARKPESKGGNALPEFLLALAMGKLRLHSEDFQSAIELVSSLTFGVSPSTDLLLRILKAKVTPDT